MTDGGDGEQNSEFSGAREFFRIPNSWVRDGWWGWRVEFGILGGEGVF